MKTRLLNLLRKTRLTSDLVAHYDLRRSVGYLRTLGWFESVHAAMAIDREGNPIPWFTYPSIAFLEPRVERRHRVFEYGSGNSTLWWSVRAGRVASCEHDERWYRLMREKLPEEVVYLHRELEDGAYAGAILESGERFHIVVIDGRDRVRCVRRSLEALEPDGVFLWDNSDREAYREGYDLLNAEGFRRLDFWGLCPINSRRSCTSVFYREENCLGL